MKLFTRVLTSLIVANAALIRPALAADSEARFNQCAVDLCGKPEQSLRYAARGILEKSSHEDLEFISKELDPQLNAMLDSSAKLAQTQNEAMDKLIEKEKTTPLSEEQKAVLIVMGYFVLANDKMGKALDSADGSTYQINRKKLGQELPKLLPQTLDQMTIVFNAFLKTEGFTNANFYGGMKYETLAAQKGSSLSWELAIWSARAVDYSRKIGDLFFADSDLRLLTKADLDEGEKKSVMSALSRLSAISGVLDPSVLAITANIPMTIADESKLLGWKSRAKNMAQLFSSPKALQSLRQTVLDDCHKKITQALATAPSELRQRRLIQLTAQVKKAATQTASLYFSGAQLTAAEKSIDQAMFTKPLGVQATKSLIKTTLREESDAISRRTELTKTASQGGDGWQALALRTLSVEENASKQQIFARVKETCYSLEPKPFEDASYTKIIQMGWQSAAFQEVGAGVMAHELGHVVSRAVEKNSNDVTAYVATRSCSMNTHAMLAKSPQEQSNITKFAEEDWADAFAATTIKELNKVWPYTTNFACPMIDLDKKKPVFVDLELVNSLEADTHSSGLLRALQIQINLGREIPQSCYTAMTAKEKNALLQTCAK